MKSERPADLARSARTSRAGDRGPGVSRYFCSFWLGGQLYAIDVAYVGEVISIQESIRVPRAPFAVAGMCAVRGTALAIIDLALLLDLPAPPFTPGGGPRSGAEKGQRALVFRSTVPVGAAPIDRVELVTRYEHAELRGAPGSGREGRPVLGILELTQRGSLRATLLDGAQIIERIGRKAAV